MVIQEAVIVGLLGKYLDDIEVINFLRILSGEPVVQYFSENCHYLYYNNGISLIFEEDDYLSTIFLYSKDVYWDFSPCVGEFPFGLDFQCTQTEVRARLGKPTHTGGNVYSKELDGLILPWDRYDGDDIVTHYEYGGEHQKIYMITLMTADEAPEL